MKKIVAILLCIAMCFALGVSVFAGDVISTDVVTSDPATSDPATSDPATSDPATSDPATSDPATSDPATSDPASSDPASSDPASSDPASSDPASSDPASSDPASSDPASSDADTTTTDADTTTTDADTTTTDADTTTTDPETSVFDIYTDVNSEHVFADAILWCKDNAYMIGYRDGSFKPGQAITRAQVCTVFFRLAGSPSGAPAAGYADASMIAADFVAAVDWAKQTGVMIGYYDNNFRPNQAITREEFVTVFFRFVKAAAGSETALQGFTDAADVAAVHAPAMCWAIENGMILGYENNKIDPKGNLTRGAMAAIIYRYFANVDTTTTDVDTTSTDVESTVVTSDVESTVVTSDVESTVVTTDVESTVVTTAA